MVMFNAETSEIAKPSELLTSVRAYMNVLQGSDSIALNLFWSLFSPFFRVLF